MNSISQAGFGSAPMSPGGGRTRVLIVSSNPYSFCIGVERHLARQLADNAVVDGLDLYEHVTRHTPFYQGVARRLTEKINRKYRRFIVPELTGRDITNDFALSHADIPPPPATIEELRDYRVDGAGLGLGVLSSMVSRSTLQHVDRLDEFGPELDASWRAAHLSLRAGRIVREMGYDEVYLFNGRHCYARPFVDTLEQVARVIRYETGGSEDTTTYVSTDENIHDPKTLAGLIEGHDVDVEEGTRFYEERLNRAAGNQVNHFIGIQTVGHIPEALKGRRYVAFLTSSTDERVAAFGRHELGAFTDQCDVALALARACAARGLTLAVRLHPHLRFKRDAWRREWDFEALEQAGAVVVMPDAACDSYALAKGAYAVVTGGSTMSFECSFLGLPNAVVGECLQTYMGSSVTCLSEADLEAFLDKPVLPPEARDRAITYGSYMRVGGIPISGYTLNGHVSQVRLDGRIADPVRWLVHRVRQLVRR